MKIQLKNWKITNLNFSLTETESERVENSFNLATASYFQDSVDVNVFGVEFKLKIEDKQFDLFIEAMFHFELMDESVTEEFKLSSFPKVNAPAIAFPYLRAFVSNLTLQSGLEPIILPSINFVKLAEENSNTEN